ncbi:hypothetical protein ACYF6T_19240 [Streptomyces sp. 7R007]
MRDEDKEWTCTVNFMSAVRATRAALPHLLATGAGRGPVAVLALAVGPWHAHARSRGSEHTTHIAGTGITYVIGATARL